MPDHPSIVVEASHYADANANEPLPSYFSTTSFAALLRAYVERLELLDAELKAVANRRRDLLAKAKDAGISTAPLKQIVKERALSPDAREELAHYRAAANRAFADTPLGHFAGADAHAAE